MAVYTSTDLAVRGPSFTVTVTGSLLGVTLTTDIIGALVEAVVTIARGTVRGVVIALRETYIDIRIAVTEMKARIRTSQLKAIVQVYSDKIKEAPYAFPDPEIAGEYEQTLREALRLEFQKYLRVTI